MELRHSKVEVASHALQKGGRCPSTSSNSQQISSALNESEKLKSSGASFRSFHSGHFKEVELTRSLSEDSLTMKKKILPSDYIEMADRGEAEASYDNPGLDLTEESSYSRENSSKMSVSSAVSTGLVLERNRNTQDSSRENPMEINAQGNPTEGQKYKVYNGNETTPIHVKAADAAYTVTDKYQAPRRENNLDVRPEIQQSNSSVDHTNLSDSRLADPPATHAHDVERQAQCLGEKLNNFNCYKDEFLEFRRKLDQDFLAEDQAILKRSKTQETNSSVPSTSNTCDSSHVPSSSYYGDSIRDETLQIGCNSTDFGSSSISQSSTDQKRPAKQFEAPEGVSATSMKTYQIVENEGVRLGRCILMSMIVLTFFVTMILAILLLLMPTSAPDKTSGSSMGGSTRGAALLPGLRSMKSGRSFVKHAEHLHKMPTLNLTLPPHNAPL